MNPKGNPQNLTPFPPGNNANPEGRNQYTYRREAEAHLEEWCREFGRDLIRKVANEAKAGKPWAAKLLLDRVLPVVTQHEVTIPETVGADALLDRLAGIAAKRRTNGSGAGAEPRRANGGNGTAA